MLPKRTETEGSNGRTIFLVFAVCLVVPLELYVGPLRLSPSRIFLIAMIVPSVLRLFRGFGAPFELVDILLLCAVFWVTISLTYNHPFQDVFQRIGMFYIECYGAFIFGRAFVTDIKQFKNAISAILLSALILLPFAIAENVTGTDQYLTIIRKLGSTYGDVFLDPAYDRWGLDRAQGPFPHPIHFGIFFCIFFGVVSYGALKSRKPYLKIPMLGVLLIGTVSSLSSGPLTALAVQVGLVSYDFVLKRVRNRWVIAGILFLIVYVGIDLLSNRTPFHVLATYLSFSEETAYDRIRIWEYGWVNIAQHPLFGVGIDDWERAWFMTASFDMFWLIWGVQNGLPALLFWLFFWISHTVKISRSKIANTETSSLRTGYLISSLGLFIAGWTVHFWNEIFILFMFFMGSGLWFASAESESISQENGSDAKIEIEPRPGYTRFGRISRSP